MRSERQLQRVSWNITSIWASIPNKRNAAEGFGANE